LAEYFKKIKENIMCTIGVVFEQNKIITFKQCDLIPEVNFNEPEKRGDKDGFLPYIALTRGEGEGRLWSGVNMAGVSFVAADAYTASSLYNVTDEDTAALFDAYENSIKRYENAHDASNFLKSFYLGEANGAKPFPAPDIALHTGWEDKEKKQPIAIFTEYMPGPHNHSPVRQIIRSNGFFVSTNHFRMQPEAITYPNNHSTYLRLNRAEAILQSNPTRIGVGDLLCDQYYGKTELSICRVTEFKGQEFHTQATALFTADPSREPICEYQVNGNPKCKPLKPFKPYKL
jgi:hypothetical protein